MNPFQAIMGRFNPLQASAGQTPMAMGGGPLSAIQATMQRAQQIASAFQNPQQLVRQYFPDAPAEVSGNPDQLIGWLQQTGRVNPQMVQMARQMMGR